MMTKFDLVFSNTRKHDPSLKLEQFGRWVILGEDPNCDLGGVHSEPELEIVDGEMVDVISYAIRLPGFFLYGSGGRLKLLPSDVKLITSKTVEQCELVYEKKKLEKRLAEIEKELGK